MPFRSAGCRRHLIEKAWLGQGPSKIRKYTATGQAVHRIKVDERAGFITTTSQQGGLDVTDLEANELLQYLPKARPSAF